MDEALKQIVGVLTIAMIVALAARRFELPYTVGLVIVCAVLFLSTSGRLPPFDACFHFRLDPAAAPVRGGAYDSLGGITTRSVTNSPLAVITARRPMNSIGRRSSSESVR